MFPQINPLPRAERQATAAHGNAQIDRGQRRAHVCGHVVVAFAGVREQRIAIRHETLEESLQIGAHVRVGIFLNEQGRRRVPHVERDEAVAETVLGNPRFNRAREVVEAASARGNAQFVLGLTEHESISDEYSRWPDELHESLVSTLNLGLV